MSMSPLGAMVGGGSKSVRELATGGAPSLRSGGGTRPLLNSGRRAMVGGGPKLLFSEGLGSTLGGGTKLLLLLSASSPWLEMWFPSMGGFNVGGTSSSGSSVGASAISHDTGG